MEQHIALVLAAGEGKRMKSKKSKVTHQICGKSLIEWVYTSIDEAGINKTIVVVGNRAEQVKECMGDVVSYAVQEQQLGTGHAVMQAQEYLENKEGYVLILCGDAPLITSESILKTIQYHKQQNNSATVITAEIPDPTGYGRILRNSEGNVLKIIEHRDATDEQRKINEINSGMYCFTIKNLLEALGELNNDNSQGEYYLTDTLEILISKGLKVGALILEDSNEIMGINDRIQLSEAGVVLKKRILENIMRSGVTIMDPATTYIESQVVIGMDSIIYPGTIIEGKTVVGEDCIIGAE